MRSRNRGFGVALLYVLIGGLVGSLIGHLLSPLWAPLGQNDLTIGTNPGTNWTLNLGVFGISLGLWLQLNLGGIIGIVAGLAWYRRRG